MVETGKAFLCDFGLETGFDFEIRPWTQIEGDDLRGPLAQAMADIFPRDDEITVLIVLAAQNDMGVGVAGVEMIHRHPFELRSQILFHLCHEAADKGFQIFVFGRIFG